MCEEEPWYECDRCGWEGPQSELKGAVVPDERVDHVLREVEVCPECRSEDLRKK